MVPVPMSDGWHEEQIDELFASLAGNGTETVVDIDPTGSHAAEVETPVVGSLRVFG